MSSEHDHSHDHGHDHDHQPKKNAAHDHRQREGEAEEAVGKALGVIFTAMKVFMVILLFFVIRSGYFTVDSGKQVLTFKFKKIMNHDGESVLKDEGSVHLIIPKPFGEVLEFSSAHSPMSLTSERFWPKDTAQALGREAGQGDSKKDFYLDKDGCVMTGDLYLYHVRPTLTYRVTDPVAYYKSFYGRGIDQVDADKKAREILTLLLDQSVAKESAVWEVDEAFYRNPNGFSIAILERLKLEVEGMGFGISCDRIDVRPEDRKPLAQLQGSFASVSKAVSDANNRVAKAREQKERLISKARQDAYASEQEAEVFKNHLVSSLKNRSDKFLSFMEVYDPNNPQESLLPLYMTSLSQAMRSVKHKFIVSGSSDPKNEIRIKLSPLAKSNEGGN
jgi:regulator of protease activity HflC (stomatin/prohibitin superfamily)